jgi:hypothetical protein
MLNGGPLSWQEKHPGTGLPLPNKSKPWQL